MNLPEILTTIAIVVAVLFGVPTWITVHQNRRRRDLNHRIRQFRKDLATTLKAARKSSGLSMEQLAGSVSPRTLSEDVADWERTGEIPHLELGKVLDILGVSDWDYRSLALNTLSSPEFKRHIEPAGQRGSSDEALVAARRTWLLAGRYSDIQIPIVAAESRSLSQFRTLESENYTYLDNLCDRDSLVELTRTISRLFPNSTVSLECATSYPASAMARPLILLGGIGYPGHPNNGFALDVVRALHIDLHYTEMTLVLEGETWESSSAGGVITKDAGLFARLTSPLDSGSKIFLVQGTHTRGVHGAAKAFSLGGGALKNHQLCHRTVGDKDFVAAFDVHVVGGEILVPELTEGAFHIRS